MGIHELEKMPGVPCERIVGGRCSLYLIRPPSCRVFLCHWLDEKGVLTEADRPDLSGVIAYLAGKDSLWPKETGLNIFVAMEVRPGAFATSDILARISKDTLTMTVKGKFLRGLLGPPELVARGRAFWASGKQLTR